MRELVDLGLAIQDLPILAANGLIKAGDLQIEPRDLQITFANLLVAVRDLRVLPCNLCNQITGQFAQLFCVQPGE